MSSDRPQRARPSRGGKAPAKAAARSASRENIRLRGFIAEQSSALRTSHRRQDIRDRLASIGALAAGLGHDMNNVLLPVRAHLEAASTLAMVPAVRRHVEAVQTSVTYLQQLADGLHYLSLDPERESPEPAATDLRVWWSQAGSLLTKAIPKHARFAVAIPAGLPQVGLSAHSLTQVALNLIVNAGEAIPANGKRWRGGGGRVRLWAETTESGKRVRLAVTDNGRGMSEEVQRSAFSMFYTTKSRGMGTGLGLSLVARVIDHAHGSVHVESRLGEGTTVSVLLPVATRKAGTLERAGAAVRLKDQRAADLVCHLLEAAGVRVVARSNPGNANIWVMEPTKGNLESAMAWRTRRPLGVLVLLGKPRSGSPREWQSLRPVTIENPNDLNEVRAAVGRAIRDS
jgi:signal transduction histidine kinase